MSLFEDSHYQGIFTKLSLENETIESKDFEDFEFDGCSFIDCKFLKSRFINCRFNECNFSLINPLESRFIDVTFTKSKVMGFDWTKAKNIQDLTFDSCQINYSNFDLLKIPKTKMVNCEAKEVEFIETDFSNGDFHNTDFERSRFFKTNLSEADFRGARNYVIDVKNNILRKARFSLPEALVLLDSLEILVD